MQLVGSIYIFYDDARCIQRQICINPLQLKVALRTRIAKASKNSLLML